MLWRASDIHGSAVEATDGSIGSVGDFLFSDDNWIIRWAVVDTGNWLPGRQVLLPPNRLKLPDAQSGDSIVALNRRQVEDGREIDGDPPVSGEGERRYVFSLWLGCILGVDERERDCRPARHRPAA